MIGRLLGNRYEIMEKIGGGGMAIVYKAKCNLLNRYVAVKILRTEFTNDRDLINKFKGESQAAASLSHPNIVNIYDVGESEDIYYIVMEYVKGKTLKELIKEEGPMTSDSIIDYTKQIAYALQHAHQNHIIHRDIKPHNILVTGDNRAKVTDFGIAVAATSSTITNAGSVIGSVHYFSPEQARGGYTDEKSDLYSLGIVMYEMATGRVPFEGESPIAVALKHIQEKPAAPSVINPSVSKALEDIILKLMNKEQASRYQNAAALIEDLNKLKSSALVANFLRPVSEEDSPTQVIPTVRDVDLDSITPRSAVKAPSNEKSTSASQKKEKKGNKAVAAAAVALALIAALLFTYGIFYAGSWLKVNEIEVPNLVGKNVDEAEAELTSLGLKIKTDDKYDREVEKGVIISQNQAPGMTVKKNFPVEVVVSLGSRPAEVPDLIYKNAEDAEFLLKNAGLRAGDNILEKFSDYPIGVIIEQEPQAGTEVPEGSEVNYTISKGKEIVSFPMPSVIGQDIRNAEAILLQSKLVLGNVKEEVSRTIPKNIVMEQSVPVGTEVEENTLIDLVISKGPETEQVGEPDNGDAANTSTQPAQTSTRVITIDLKEFRNTIVDVKIYQMINNQPVEIFAKKHNTAAEDSTLRFSVRDSGTQTFEIHINGKLDKRIEIDF